jgi:hypothetical protein
MEYIKLNEIVNEVKNTLSSYFENNLVDDSIMYPSIKLLSKKFGLRIRNVKKDVLEVYNSKATIPLDFYKLKLAVGCFERTEVFNDDDYRQPVRITQETSNYKVNHCETDICTNECNEIVRLVQSRLDRTIFEWTDFKPLKLNTISTTYADKDCHNLKIQSENEITFHKGEIIANFDKGDIYIEYYTLLEDDDQDILIPDNEILINAYRTQMIKDVFEYLMYNSAENVVQKYQLATANAKLAYDYANSYLKTPEVKDFYKIKNYQVFNYKKINNGK